jgi:hypothetical protein
MADKKKLPAKMTAKAEKVKVKAEEKKEKKK